MYFVWLLEVLKRAFTATPRMTDVFQILAASAVPIVTNVAGIDLPSDTLTRVFAYIGIMAFSFFIIRLFWSPYAMWKDDKLEIGELKLALTKPERMVLEHLAKIRAKERAKVVRLLLRMHRAAYLKDSTQKEYEEICTKIIIGADAANLGQTFRSVFTAFYNICNDRKAGKLEKTRGIDFDLLDGLILFANSEIKAEDLVSLLPPSTAPETPQ